MISATEAKELADNVNKTENVDNELNLIEEKIKDACAKGEYEILICRTDEESLSPYIRDVTKKVLIAHGYHVLAWVQQNVYVIIISWGTE